MKCYNVTCLHSLMLLVLLQEQISGSLLLCGWDSSSVLVWDQEKTIATVNKGKKIKWNQEIRIKSKHENKNPDEFAEIIRGF